MGRFFLNYVLCDFLCGYGQVICSWVFIVREQYKYLVYSLRRIKKKLRWSVVFCKILFSLGEWNVVKKGVWLLLFSGNC